jgi:hypothetical protein
MVLVASTGIFASVSAITEFLIADGTSATVVQLQRWLSWPLVIVFVSSLVVSMCSFYGRNRGQRS